jgi:hypothetical protein
MITLCGSKHVALETTFNIALNDIHTTSLILTALNRIAFPYIHNMMDTLKLKFWKLFSPAHGCASRLTNTLDIEMKILHSVCSLLKSFFFHGFRFCWWRGHVSLLIIIAPKPSIESFAMLKNVRMWVTLFWNYGPRKRMGLIILDALITHHTPTLKSCNGAFTCRFSQSTCYSLSAHIPWD